MNIAKQHWPILRELGTDLANRVRSFMVVGMNGVAVLVITEDGQGFLLGKRTTTKPIPLNVPGLVQMAQSESHILLLTENGQIYSMKIFYGNFELGFFTELISIPHKFISVRCGKVYSVALTEDGKVWTLGKNVIGRVGLPGSDQFFQSFSQISNLDSHRVVAIECGAIQALALTDQGEIYDWNMNFLRQFVNGRELSTPTIVQIPTPSPVKSIAVGCLHALLLTRTGEVYAHGSNRHGQLGFPVAEKSSNSLVKVAGLPSISQIASHYSTNLSIAMSFDKRCFVWGEMRDGTFIFTPKELPSDYSTVESPLSFYSTNRTTPHSVSVPETLPSRLSARMSRMFDDTETSDVQFVVEQRTINAHRMILSYSSEYFARMFSKKWLPQVVPEDPIVKVTIPNYSYQAFYSFLRFLYTDCLEIHLNQLPELFELANQYLESKLEKLCMSRMHETLTTATCCFYYSLTHRLSLPELDGFQQELVQFASTRMSEIAETAAYQSMESDLRDNLTNAVENLTFRST